MIRLPIALVAALAAALAACTVYQPAPGVYAPMQQAPAYNRSWVAALDAMRDQGVDITTQDASRGVILGRRGGIEVAANVLPQVDGSVRVEFNTAGATSQDPDLINRISRSYDARMGR